MDKKEFIQNELNYLEGKINELREAVNLTDFISTKDYMNLMQIVDRIKKKMNDGGKEK